MHYLVLEPECLAKDFGLGRPFGNERSSYAGAMIELRVNEELKNTIMVAMLKLVDVVKNSNTPRQATRGVSVGPKVSFKSTKQIYKLVSNKDGASTSGKKKQAEVARQEVINLNPSEALNLIENDDDLGTNGRSSSSDGKGVASSSISTTLIAERIDKIKRQMIEGKLLLVDDDEKPLPNVVSTINADSDSEVEEVFDEHATFMVSTGLKRSCEIGYGTNSLWEQWKETKHDDDSDPYDDDLYDGYDMSDNLQTICD
uniref:Uncharacterized protein n=1 Tax=Tanacetum cinerariifolium TaxID=118510 RepID=A0A699GIS4_TANCI|nr:hypothetical protein [Tanacetum cinerariifolium]